MTPRFDFRFVGALALALPPLGLPLEAAAQQSGQSAPPPAVVVATVKDEEISQSAQFVGRIQAIQQVALQARVEGFLEEVDFQEGALVKNGELLYQIETAPYEAALAGAQASLAAGNAAQASAQAALTDADLTLERQKSLLKSGTASQAAVDKAQSVRDQNYAQLQGALAQIAEANAQIQTAQLNLGYTKVTSPIDGRIGKTNYTQGNLVNPASGTLSTVVQMNPIRVVFSIAERDYVNVVEDRAETPNVDMRDDFVPSLLLPNGKVYDQKGQISFVDNQVDPQTGTIAVYADFANEDYELVPGSFVTVTVEVGKPQSLPVIPAGAVLQDKDGPYVLVVDTDDRAQIRRIETAKKTSTGWAVSKGLTQGETIIVDGIQKVRPGMVVSPQTAQTAS